MRHQRQGPSQCWPASVCMLIDYDLHSLMDDFISVWGAPWNKLWHGGRHNEMIRWVLHETRAPECLSVVGLKIPMGRPPKPSLPNKKGMLIARMHGAIHAVAYEDGLVYDPLEDGPMPFWKWVEYNPRIIRDIPIEIYTD